MLIFLVMLAAIITTVWESIRIWKRKGKTVLSVIEILAIVEFWFLIWWKA